MGGGCLGGRQVRAGFLGPPRVLSSVATSEGPFVCPFIQKSGCDCIGYKAPVGPDFPPLPVAQQEEGFPGSRESAGDPDLLFLGPRPVHSSSLHQLPAAPTPSPCHSHQPGAPCSSRAHICTHSVTSSCAKRWGKSPGRCCFLRSPAAKRFWRFAEMQAGCTGCGPPGGVAGTWGGVGKWAERLSVGPCTHHEHTHGCPGPGEEQSEEKKRTAGDRDLRLHPLLSPLSPVD